MTYIEIVLLLCLVVMNLKQLGKPFNKVREKVLEKINKPQGSLILVIFLSRGLFTNIMYFPMDNKVKLLLFINLFMLCHKVFNYRYTTEQRILLVQDYKDKKDLKSKLIVLWHYNKIPKD